jgi:hypothetical protein
VLDVAASQKLAGSLYRLISKAAARADDGDKPEDVDAALQMRELSLVYLAASGKVGVAEVVAQVVKTAKFYDAKPLVRGSPRMALFHTRLLERLSPVLLQLVSAGKVSRGVLALCPCAPARPRARTPAHPRTRALTHTHTCANIFCLASSASPGAGVHAGTGRLGIRIRTLSGSQLQSAIRNNARKKVVVIDRRLQDGQGG